MKIPATLEHSPVMVSENYNQVDGRLAGHSDLKGLSLGLDRQNNNGKVNISAKVWEYTGEEWSEQSEKLPLHRVLDLSILICRSLEHFRDAYRYEHLYDPQESIIDRVGLQGGSMKVGICTDNENINEDIRLLNQALSDDDELIGERLRALAKILMDMGY